MEELQNYTKTKLTIDLTKVNSQLLYVLIPIIILFGIPYYFLWTEQFTLTNAKDYIQHVGTKYKYFLGAVPLVVLTLGIVAHELIHGITFAMFTKRGFKSIKFGIQWKQVTPYCHCEEPLKVKHYILGAIMPAIIIGLIPSIIAIVTGDFPLLVFGMFFTLAAIGDFMIIYLLKDQKANDFVLDHPSEAGCYVFQSGSE